MRRPGRPGRRGSILRARGPMGPTGGAYFLRTNFSLRTKIRIFERRFEIEDCICFNLSSVKSNRIQAAGENCRKSAATAARAPD